MLVAPIRTRAKSTRLVAYAVLQNSIAIGSGFFWQFIVE